jgi:hypothetical protein
MSPGTGLNERHGRVDVLIDLKTQTAEPECLDRLEGYGPSVVQISGSSRRMTYERARRTAGNPSTCRGAWHRSPGPSPFSHRASRLD